MQSFNKMANIIDEANKIVINSVKDYEEYTRQEVINKVNALTSSGVDSTQDVENILSNIDSEFGWSGKAYSSSYLKNSIDEINKVNTAILRNLGTNAGNDFVSMTGEISKRVISGGLSKDQAVRLTLSGYNGTTIAFKGGTTYPIRSYLEMVYRGQIGNAARSRALDIGKQIGSSVFQVSEHANPRESCSRVQGGLISFDGTTRFGKYEVKPASVANYGTAGGLGGVNCNHFWIPVSRALKDNIPGLDKFINMEA